MNRTIPIILLLLVGSLGFVSVWQYVENQRLQTERDQYRQQLDESAAKLREAQEEQIRLEAELSQNRAQLTELQRQVGELENRTQTLEREIEQLRDELGLRQNAVVTIGLTLLWNPAINIGSDYLASVVMWMNEHQWRDFGVYFFIYHAHSEDFVPEAVDCHELTSQPMSSLPWADKAWNLFPKRDIPIIIARMTNVEPMAYYAGCVPYYRTGVVVVDAGRFEAGITFHSVPSYGATITTHEILHVLGFRAEVEELDYWNLVIPPSWGPKIVLLAKAFQMTLPTD